MSYRYLSKQFFHSTKNLTIVHKVNSPVRRFIIIMNMEDTGFFYGRYNDDITLKVQVLCKRVSGTPVSQGVFRPTA